MLMTNGGAVLAIALSGLAACQEQAATTIDFLDATGTRPMAPISTAGQSRHGITYYVRTDGGDAIQCSGRSDDAYPGSGHGQACAWKNPHIALPPSGTARIAGGDTLIIGSGTYQIGSGGQMQPVPSGPSAAAPTRILGKPGATAPKLVGINGIHRVLNLEGSSNIEVGHLEITDQSDCVFGHSNPAAACKPGEAWARGGIYASASRNVWLHDLDIHGLGARGIQAGGLTDWTVERVKLNRNGTAGWAGDIDGDSANSGRIILRDIEIGWNGCGERWQTREAWACWGEQTDGYGDGLGVATTGGQWLIEDAYVHHNTQDGLDLLYMDGAANSSVTLRRIHAVANAGNQIKVSGNALIEHSVIVGHCTYFKGRYFMVEGDYCRAYGASVLLNLTGNNVAVVRHNTIAGEGDTLITHIGGDSSDRIHIHDNVAVGFPYYRDPDVLTRFSGGGAPAVKRFEGNLAWNVRPPCPTGAVCDKNPRLANMKLATFSATAPADSPAAGPAR